MEMRVASQLTAIIFHSFINSLDTCKIKLVFNIQQNKTSLRLKGLHCTLSNMIAPF